MEVYYEMTMIITIIYNLIIWKDCVKEHTIHIMLFHQTAIYQEVSILEKNLKIDLTIGCMTLLMNNGLQVGVFIF